MKVAVVGASGFVGAAVRAQLVSEGHDVSSLRCPRVLGETNLDINSKVFELAEKLNGINVVVNCAGVPDAAGTDKDLLFAGNAFAPEVVAAACDRARLGRFIHVSSAAVQGRRRILDSTENYDEFSLYSQSKAEGERRVRSRFRDAVVYRPPGVHDASRSVSQSLVSLASSSLASVAGNGERPSPQALLKNVASAVAFLATVNDTPPSVVSHPWEGVTTGGLLESLSGKKPKRIPEGVASFAISAGYAAAGLSPAIAGNVRRVEVLWFGQGQANSWLTHSGWTPPLGEDAWREMGDSIRRRK